MLRNVNIEVMEVWRDTYSRSRRAWERGYWESAALKMITWYWSINDWWKSGSDIYVCVRVKQKKKVIRIRFLLKIETVNQKCMHFVNEESRRWCLQLWYRYRNDARGWYSYKEISMHTAIEEQIPTRTTARTELHLAINSIGCTYTVLFISHRVPWAVLENLHLQCLDRHRSWPQYHQLWAKTIVHWTMVVSWRCNRWC